VTIGAVAPAPLEISLARGDARIEGTLINAENQPIANAQIVLIPNTLRSRADLYKTATSDAMGCFSFSAILPGDYKAFAWASVQPYGYFDKDFLSRFENRGEPVRTENGNTTTITVHQIP
jgi:hypothetical protein